jgi:hypothetical protein
MMVSTAVDAGPQFVDCISAPGGVPRTQALVIPQQGGGPSLQAKVYAPQASLQTAPCPCIALLPGSAAPIISLDWAAALLAKDGYVVITVAPQTAGSTDSYNIAAKSAIDFLHSPANPFAADTDTTAVGAGGWSLAGRSLVRTQEEDPRIDSLVSWDHLAKSESGDAGSPFCFYTPIPLRIPTVPAMGQASETCDNGPQCKKIPFEHWKSGGMETMIVVFEGWTHFAWTPSATAQQHSQSHYYTLAWFDRWLKNKPDATGRLLATSVDGVPLDQLLSDEFFSAVFFDGFFCPDFRAGCEPIAPEDLYIDGEINGLDLAVLLGAWGRCKDECPADISGDGMVNGVDLAALLGAWD